MNWPLWTHWRPKRLITPNSLIVSSPLATLDRMITFKIRISRNANWQVHWPQWASCCFAQQQPPKLYIGKHRCGKLPEVGARGTVMKCSVHTIVTKMICDLRCQICHYHTDHSKILTVPHTCQAWLNAYLPLTVMALDTRLHLCIPPQIMSHCWPFALYSCPSIV